MPVTTRQLSRRKVYGAIQRIIHAWIGAVVVALVALGWMGKFVEPGAPKALLTQAHITFGYGLVIGCVARLVWGLIGPQQARFSALMHPTAWWAALRRTRSSDSHAFGHDPFASAAYLLLYTVLAASVLSGLALAGIRYDMGPFASTMFDDFRLHELAIIIHEMVLYVTTAFIVLHMGAMVVHEKRRGYPIAQAMVSGYQYRPSSQEEKSHD